MSTISRLDNRTPFEATHLLTPDGQGGEAVLLVVKATFEIGADGRPQLVPDPAPIRLCDEFIGDPSLGSPLADTDLALFKPRVDVVVVGAQAHAPRGRPIDKLFVELHVGHPDGVQSSEAAHDAGQAQLIKSLLVTGDRVWVDDQPGEPLPFVSMPLGWERAYGGTVRGRDGELDLDQRNPLGIGWAGARSGDPAVLSELPNVEDPASTMVRRQTACVPAGFGVVSRAWLPRRALAGTFDIGWQRRRWPLLPHDHDPACNQSVAADQQLERFVGGEPVRLVNLTPEGEWLFRLPHLDVPIHAIRAIRASRAIRAGQLERVGLRVDTIEIDPERRRLSLTGRVALPVARSTPPIEELVIGHVPPGWLRARASGKCYVQLRGADQVPVGRPYFY
ncbi:putative exported protein [Enhygromyxa salina]|uniref:Putative exported protein n=1 Tax=Enhygromyxa salina TaxID=215803 RepID=A0A0C2A6N5_9BACT|nr:DUF2169 domain-containing protein [Enhygromyxa salina]KIG19048.1 putative exported protein [Enhygromyxa salina]